MGERGIKRVALVMNIVPCRCINLTGLALIIYSYSLTKK